MVALGKCNLKRIPKGDVCENHPDLLAHEAKPHQAQLSVSTNYADIYFKINTNLQARSLWAWCVNKSKAPQMHESNPFLFTYCCFLLTTHSPYPGMPSKREVVDVHHFFLPSCVIAAGLHLSEGVVRSASPF